MVCLTIVFPAVFDRGVLQNMLRRTLFPLLLSVLPFDPSLGMAVAPTAIICNGGSSSVRVVELTNPPGALFPVSVGSDPLGVVITKGNRYACVCNHNDRSLSVIDVTTARSPSPTVYTIPVGFAPIAVATTANGRYVLSCDYEADSLSVLDLNTLSSTVPTVYTIPVGTHPRSVATTPNNAYACVCNDCRSTLSIIDLSTLSLS